MYLIIIINEQSDMNLKKLLFPLIMACTAYPQLALVAQTYIGEHLARGPIGRFEPRQ